MTNIKTLWWINQLQGKPMLGIQTQEKITYNYEAKKWMTKRGVADKPVAILEKPLILRITVNGQRANLSTGIRLNPATWDMHKKEMRGWSQKASEVRECKIQWENRILEAAKATGKYYFTLEDLMLELFPERKKKKEREENPELKYNGLVKKFLHHKARTNKPTTISSASARLNSLRPIIERYYGANPALVKLNGKNFFFAMSTRLSEAGYQPRTINSMLAQLHDLLVFAEKVDDDYVLKGKLEHIAVEKQTKYYTPEQLSAIDSFQPAKETHGIMQMILMFIYESGVSQVDLAYLTQDNITLDKEGNEYLYFHRQKTSGLSVVHLTETARQLLALMQPFVSIYHRFRKQQDVSRHLIPMPKKDSTYAYLSQISKELGFSVTLHPMRHNFAMRQLNDYGRSIEAVSRMLGHISVSTTEQEYAFVTEVRVHKEISKLNNYTSYEKSQNKGSQG